MVREMIAIKVSRALGASLCRLKSEHNYVYPNGCYSSWCAYACVRCGELDTPLDELPPAPDFDDSDYRGYDDRDLDEAAHRRECRWFQCLPWPRWL